MQDNSYVRKMKEIQDKGMENQKRGQRTTGIL